MIYLNDHLRLPMDKISKCNLTKDQLGKLTVPKFDSWLVDELRSEGKIKYFTLFERSTFGHIERKTNTEFLHTDHWSSMFIPTSWFDVIGKSEDKLREEIELAGKENEGIKNACIEFESCHGVTRVSWFTYISKQERDEMELDSFRNSRTIVKFVKELLCCTSFDV